MTKWFLSLLLLMCCITSIDLLVLNHRYIPEMKPTWSWGRIFLICSWIGFAIILLRIFALMLIKEIGLQFFFLDVSLSGLGMNIKLAS
jgi:membrane-anchored protein YejM (alkaline phosphatase superfamily)